MTEKPAGKSGIARLRAAFLYSLAGLGYAFRNEEAFRQEAVLYVLLLAGLFFLPVPLMFKGLLFIANTLCLIVELLNTAIEAVVDLASPEYHELAKQAKDVGSAAVLVVLTMTIVLWGAALYLYVFV